MGSGDGGVRLFRLFAQNASVRLCGVGAVKLFKIVVAVVEINSLDERGKD